MVNDTSYVRAGASLLETLTSALYADPLVVFREYVQNSVDSFVAARECEVGQRPDFCVNIDVNLRDKKIVIDDNGMGLPEPDFDSTMKALGKSSKSGSKGQIGFRGIGRLSGLAFCEKVVFLNKKYGQRFCLDGGKYREILNSPSGGTLPLEDVMQEITEASGRVDPGSDCGFRVEMIGVTDELLDVVVGRSRNRVQEASVSSEFVDALRLMLPLPYPENFDKRKVIEDEYSRLLGKRLSDSEFVVKLNGKPLFKNVSNVEDRAFILMPLKLNHKSDTEPVTIGLLWLSFNFLLRSVGKNFGISVRSRNMLVQGGPIFANEATQGAAAITTYGQYLAVAKAMTGELLLDTVLLSDNSRRDWFKLDVNASQLRERICDVMNAIHQYRYAISKYVNSDDKNDTLKQRVFEAYRQIEKHGQGLSGLSLVKGFVGGNEEMGEPREVDERSDVDDIRGYSKPQRVLYKKLMDCVYEYYNKNNTKNGLTDYYALKSFVVKHLNGDVGEETDA